MKHKSIFTKLIFALIFGFILFTTQLSAQKYGYDVIINNQPTADQRSPKLTIAFNGWMFASYLYGDSSRIFKSVDDGVHWTYLNGGYGAGIIDMVVCGTSTADLYLFVAAYITATKQVFVIKVDANTGAGIQLLNYTISGDNVLDLKIASDYKFPATGASPYSVAVAFTMRPVFGNDSLFCWTSGDGGATFPIANKKVVDVTPDFFRKISLCYGRSPNNNNGRYFIAYEQTNTGEVGHIKYARTSNAYNDDFTAPQFMDNIGGTLSNDCKNPVISCQADNSNNSIGKLTAIITFDRKFSATDSDIQYVHSLDAADVSSTWTLSFITNSAAVETQADVVYDPVNHNFLATYYDQSTQKLLFKLIDFNLTNPNNWLVYNAGYNDSPALSNPFPQIDINPLYTRVAFVWCKDGAPTTNGVIMYDGENSTYNNINDLAAPNDIKLYPNPASDYVNIKTSTDDDYTVAIYNITGQEVLMDNFQGSSHRLNLRNIPKGYYLLKITSDISSYTEKLIIQ